MHGGAGMKISKDKIILAVFFVLFLALNAYLVFIHEPWRDEIHAWLITREMSIPEMITFSRYEAHPILWNLLLFPFAKLGVSPYSMYVISYLLVAVSAWLFLFKTEINKIAKVLILFSVPFVYIFSSIARDYCLILFLGMIICVMYKSRYEHPVIYSLVVSLLVFSHAMAWGFVAGVTITFNIYEIVLKLTGKSRLSQKQFRGVVIGFAMIAVSSLFAIVTLAGERSKVLSVKPDLFTETVIISLITLMLLSVGLLVLCKGAVWKECIILAATYLFMILVYRTVYSGVIFQRAEYIDKNYPDEDVFLVDSGIYAQTMVPFTGKTLYDIRYKENIVDSLYHVHDEDEVIASITDIPNHKEYKGKYLISVYKLKGTEEIYVTSDSIMGERFYLYYIPE